MLLEGLFNTFYSKIGAEDVWDQYSKEYERYKRERKHCEQQADKNKHRECNFILDLKLLMLKIKTLRRTTAYCKNHKDPSKCRNFLAKKIKAANDQLKLKRDALKALHDKMNVESRKELMKNRTTTKTVKAI